MKIMLFFVFSIGLLCSMENQELNAQTGDTASPSGKTFVGWNTAATPLTKPGIASTKAPVVTAKVVHGVTTYSVNTGSWNTTGQPAPCAR